MQVDLPSFWKYEAGAGRLVGLDRSKRSTVAPATTGGSYLALVILPNTIRNEFGKYSILNMLTQA